MLDAECQPCTTSRTSWRCFGLLECEIFRITPLSLMSELRQHSSASLSASYVGRQWLQRSPARSHPLCATLLGAALVCWAGSRGDAHAQSPGKTLPSSPAPQGSAAPKKPQASSRSGAATPSSQAAGSQLPSEPTTPTAVVLATSGAEPSDSALDTLIQSALDDLHVVNVISRPGIDLGGVLLAVDCVSETPQCLRLVTAHNGVDELIAPSLARSAGELVLTIMRFDARDGQVRRALRRQPGRTLSSATLDALPALLRELFDLPPEVKKPEAVAAPSGEVQGPLPLHDTSVPPPARLTVPIGPLVLAGAGVLMLGAGIGFGATVPSLESKHERLMNKPDRTAADVDNAKETSHEGKRNAAIANVLYGLGGAVVAGAGIWLAVQLTSRADRESVEHLAIQPLLGPQQVGLVLTQRGTGL